jgi:hypothetical protein
VKLIEDLHSVSCLLNAQSNAWRYVASVNKYGAGVVEVKKSIGFLENNIRRQNMKFEK